MNNFTPCQVIQDRLGFRIPCCGFLILGTGFWIPYQLDLDLNSNRRWYSRFCELTYGFQSPGFQIPETKTFRFLDSRSKNFPDSGIQALVVQTLDSAINQIDLYPVDKCLGNQLRYPLNRDLSRG